MAPNDVTYQLPLSQMLDLALGTPEVGSVNFNILHDFLYILLHQTNLNDVTAEYQGDEAAKIKAMVASLNDGFENDMIDMDENIAQEDNVHDRTVLATNVSNVDDQIPQKSSGNDGDIVDTSRPRIVKDLRRTLKINRPQEFSEGDLYKEINQMNDRITELEINFECLHDGVNTTISNEHDDNDKIQPEDSRNDKILTEEQIDNVKSTDHASKISGLTSASLGTSKTSKQLLRSHNYKGQLNDLKEEVLILKNNMAKVMQLVVDKEEIAEQAAEKEETIHNMNDIEIKSAGHLSSDILQTVDGAEPLVDDVDIFSVESLPNSEILDEDQSDYSDGRKSSKKLVSTASTLSKPNKDLKDESETFPDCKMIDTRVTRLEQMLNFDKFEGIEGMKDVIQNIKNIELDIERMKWIIENIGKEQETRDKNMDILTEQVDLLKIMKADREDLEDALASKADATVVNRKVSYNRFDTVYEEFAHTLEDTILKSNQQETALRETIDTVQQEVDNKLDKTEISPRYIEEKLQALQDELKELTVKKREFEASGAKKILTGLQCITCDRDVIMKRDQNELYHPDPLPYRKNIKPYLTYKLNEMRKHQKQFPAKHINLFTTAVQEMNRHKFSTNNIMEKSPRDHFSNRYCGGSHTITTPQQRVMRIGHFLADWGPEIIQLNEGLVQGTDGQLYHGRPMPPGTTNVAKVCGLDENVSCNLIEKSENFKG